MVTMNILVVLLLAGVLEWRGMSVQGQGCSLETLPKNLTIMEGTINGTILWNLTSDFEFFSKPPPPFIGLRSDALYMNATLNLDDNTAWCDAFNNGDYVIMFLQCKGGTGSSWKPISLNITSTNDHPPDFAKSTFVIDPIPELTPKGTTVADSNFWGLTDRDCAQDQSNPSIVFEIEDGNRNGAFANFTNGELSFNRTLDYENGDTRFLLNISVSDKRVPGKKSFATVEINITDLDDSDPVFNHTSYVLHVTENNQSSVGDWTHAVPPIAVYDPDIDVTPKDPLLITLLDPSDSSILKVNGTTGEVCLQRTFDHEQDQSINVVLKVQQTINSWRSSTATLTLMIDDVNDNRPLFQPHNYDVTLAEHSPFGTTVTLVSATDKDTGINAEFNYTLVTGNGEGIFSLSTQKMGTQLYGLLQVHNSALLDREAFEQAVLEIGTVEWSATDGVRCVGDQCQATVTIRLKDINDNSPRFERSSYDVTVDDVIPDAVIITVNATDEDQGANADVTYSLQSDGNLWCNYVIINQTSGDVRLSNAVTQSGTCVVIVTACDNPLNIAQQRCASVLLQITIHISNQTVVLQAPVSPDILMPEKNIIQRELSTILGVDVSVDQIYPDSEKGSRLFISAKNSTTQEPLQKAELQSLVDAKQTEIAALFDRYGTTSAPGQKEPTDGDDDFSPLVIALIVVSVVLLMAFFIAVAFVHRFRRRGQRQQRLIQRLNGTNDLYNNTASLSKAENGDASLISNIDLTDDDAMEGMGVINPVFMDDSENGSPADTPRSASDEGGEKEGGRATRLPDADSGVPSDRENGLDSDSSKETTPVMRRTDGGSLSSRGGGGSSYLDAVLGALQNDDVKDDNDDIVDVTDPPPPSFDVIETGSPRLLGDPEPDYRYSASDLPPPPPPPPGEDLEEQENTISFADSSDDLQSLDPTYLPPPPPDFHSDDFRPGGHDSRREDEEDEDDIAAASKLAMLVRPTTPPPRHRSGRNAEEEEEEENLPEEPEPDYAKKVRFNVQVTEHISPPEEAEELSPDATSGGDGGPRQDGEEHRLNGESGGENEASGERQREEGESTSSERVGRSTTEHTDLPHTEESGVSGNSAVGGSKPALNVEEETTAF